MTKKALLRYLELIDDPKVLSSSIQPQAIAWPNDKVMKAMKACQENMDLISCTVQAYELKLVKILVIMMLMQPCISFLAKLRD